MLYKRPPSYGGKLKFLIRGEKYPANDVISPLALRWKVCVSVRAAEQQLVLDICRSQQNTLNRQAYNLALLILLALFGPLCQRPLWTSWKQPQKALFAKEEEHIRRDDKVTATLWLLKQEVKAAISKPN